jgi:hypothetical protein
MSIGIAIFLVLVSIQFFQVMIDINACLVIDTLHANTYDPSTQEIIRDAFPACHFK